MTVGPPCPPPHASGGAARAASKAEIVSFTPDLLPAVRAFVEQHGSRPTTQDFYEWRYLRSAGLGVMLVAKSDGQCLGTLSAVRKPYRIGAERTMCLEVFDWHVRPEVRGTGIGIRLMRAMMRQGLRLVSVGGTDDALNALPLMGWSRVSAARHFELPLCGKELATRVERRTGLPAGIVRLAIAPLSAAYFTPRRRFAPHGASVRRVPRLDDGVAELYQGDTGYELVQENEPGALAWVMAGRWSGRYELLEFHVAGRLRGWAMTRLHRCGEGLVGVLVEMFAPKADPATYAWMVSEAAVSLSAAGARRLKASATCSALQAALVANRFRAVVKDAPIHTWPALDVSDPGRVHFTLQHADGPLRPFESTRPGHESASAR